MTRKRAERIPEYLQHILDAIGEAANRIRMIDPQFATEHPEIPWDLIYGMRNRIVHDYFEVDLEVVWRTVQQDLPTLRLQVFAVLTS